MSWHAGGDNQCRLAPVPPGTGGDAPPVWLSWHAGGDFRRRTRRTALIVCVWCECARARACVRACARTRALAGDGRAERDVGQRGPSAQSARGFVCVCACACVCARVCVCVRVRRVGGAGGAGDGRAERDMGQRRRDRQRLGQARPPARPPIYPPTHPPTPLMRVGGDPTGPTATRTGARPTTLGRPSPGRLGKPDAKG